MTWADLDKVQKGTRNDGAVMLVIADERSRDELQATRALSTIIASCRVLAARRAIASHFGAGSVVYTCTRAAAPAFLLDAVSAAGGVVFDGQPRKQPSPPALSMQLDGAFCDLAIAVKRRLEAKSLAEALARREAELVRAPPTRTDLPAYWTAIFELCALACELIRAELGGRWQPHDTARVPLAFAIGERVLTPAQLAQGIVEGARVSMRSLLDAIRPGGSTAAATGAAGQPMPVLVPRTQLPLDEVAWELLVPADADHPALPVIVWGIDQGATMMYPRRRGAVPAAERAAALGNLAALALPVDRIALASGPMACVRDTYFATEALLDRATMARVGAELGAGDGELIVALPRRGQLLAIEALRAELDDSLLLEFLVTVRQIFAGAPVREQLSAEPIVYRELPVGRLASDARDRLEQFLASRSA
jgi:hypothetical protein